MTINLQPNWSKFYAPGPEILRYLESLVDNYDLKPYLKLEHKLIHARYDVESSRWRLRLERQLGADHLGQARVEELEDTTDVLFTALGGLSRWKWPDLTGLSSFKGPVIHSADWRTGEGDAMTLGWESTVASWKDKTVGVIGVVSDLRPWLKSLNSIIFRIELMCFYGLCVGLICNPDCPGAHPPRREDSQLRSRKNVGCHHICEGHSNRTCPRQYC